MAISLILQKSSVKFTTNQLPPHSPVTNDKVVFDTQAADEIDHRDLYEDQA